MCYEIECTIALLRRIGHLDQQWEKGQGRRTEKEEEHLERSGEERTREESCCLAALAAPKMMLKDQPLILLFTPL